MGETRHPTLASMLFAWMMVACGMGGGLEVVDAATFSIIGRKVGGHSTGYGLNRYYTCHHQLPPGRKSESENVGNIQNQDVLGDASNNAFNSILSIRGGASKGIDMDDHDHGSTSKKKKKKNRGSKSSSSRKKKKKKQKKLEEETAAAATTTTNAIEMENDLNEANTGGEIVLTSGGELASSSSSSSSVPPKPLKRLKSRKVTIIRHGSYNIYSNDLDQGREFVKEQSLQDEQSQNRMTTTCTTSSSMSQHEEPDQIYIEHHETSFSEGGTPEEERALSENDKEKEAETTQENAPGKKNEKKKKETDSTSNSSQSRRNKSLSQKPKTRAKPGTGGGGKSGESLRRIKREWKDAVKLGIAFDWKTMETVTVHGRSTSGKFSTTGNDDKFWQYNYVRIGPFGSNLLRWHFSVMGPAHSHYEGGIYHGRILLPKDYPMSPPRVQMLTPSGRFLPGEDICLSASAFHPETWTPRWTVLSLVDALRLHMITSANEIGGVETSSEKRRTLAEQSRRWRVGNLDHTKMIMAGIFCSRPELECATEEESAIQPPTQLKEDVSETKKKEVEIVGEEADNAESQVAKSTLEKALFDKAALEKDMDDALEQAFIRQKKKVVRTTRSKQKAAKSSKSTKTGTSTSTGTSTTKESEEASHTLAMSVVSRDKPSITKKLLSFTWRTALILTKNPKRLIRIAVCAVAFYYLCLPLPNIK